MVKCCRCGMKFNVSEARNEYNTTFGDGLNYDEQYGGEVCADCAIPDTESLINQGRAIDMMNGDDDYDDDFVQEWL